MVITKKKYKHKYSKKLLKGGKQIFNGGGSFFKKVKSIKPTKAVGALGIGALHVAAKTPKILGQAVVATLKSPWTLIKGAWQGAKLGYTAKKTEGRKNLQYIDAYKKATAAIEESQKSKPATVAEQFLQTEELKKKLKPYAEKLGVTDLSRSATNIDTEIRKKYENKKTAYNTALNEKREAKFKKKYGEDAVYQSKQTQYNDKKRAYNFAEGQLAQLKKNSDRIGSLTVFKSFDQNKFSQKQGDIQKKEDELKAQAAELKKLSSELQNKSKRSFEGSAAQYERRIERLKQTGQELIAPAAEVYKTFENTYRALDNPQTVGFKASVASAFTKPLQNYGQQLKDGFSLTQTPYKSSNISGEYTSKTGQAFYKAKNQRSTTSLSSNIRTLGEGLQKQHDSKTDETKTRQELEKLRSEFTIRKNKYPESEMQNAFMKVKLGLPPVGNRILPPANYNDFKTQLKDLGKMEGGIDQLHNYVNKLKSTNPEQYLLAKQLYRRVVAENELEQIEGYLAYQPVKKIVPPKELTRADQLTLLSRSRLYSV